MMKKRQLEKETDKSEDLDNYSSSDVSEDEEDEEQEIDETPAQKRLRLARNYLQKFSNVDNEKIIKSYKKVADNLTGPDLDHMRILKNGHKSSITCLVVSPEGKFIYSASKDSVIVKWDFATGKRIKTIPKFHKQDEESNTPSGIINAIAITSDSKFLATGWSDKNIVIWNASDLSFLHTFKGHRGEVTGLAFRRASHTLYSCSTDKTVKVWNVDDLCYVETLFGHQDKITAIDCGLKERPITAGGIDLSLRLWKIVEESQLVFHGHKGSIDSVKYIDENHFISVGDDGIISLFDTTKKTPSFSKNLAHSETNSEPNWISALATAVNTDLFATGSKDGAIKVWKCLSGFTKFELIFTIPVVGFVNCLQFINDGDCLVVGVGREHRLGRWWNLKDAKNSIMIIPMLKLKDHQL